MKLCGYIGRVKDKVSVIQQWWIQDFPQEGAPTLQEGCQLLMWLFCKIYVRTKESGPLEWCTRCAPLGSPLYSVDTSIQSSQQVFLKNKCFCAFFHGGGFLLWKSVFSAFFFFQNVFFFLYHVGDKFWDSWDKFHKLNLNKISSQCSTSTQRPVVI